MSPSFAGAGMEENFRLMLTRNLEVLVAVGWVGSIQYSYKNTTRDSELKKRNDCPKISLLGATRHTYHPKQNMTT